jgi:hypothetical protein
MKKFRVFGFCMLVIAMLFLIGAHSGSVKTDSIDMPFSYVAAAGYLNTSDNREHAFKGTVTVNKFGRNADSDAQEESVWDGNDLGGPIRCFDVIGTTAVALYLSSDDENDASDNNAVTVTVEYLDANWDPQSLDVALGAASAGGTVFAQIGSGTIMRINRMYVTSSTAPAGNIYAGIDDVDGNADGIPDTILTDLVAGISIGENQTLQACYTVPNNFTALLTQYCTTNVTTAGNRTAVFRLRKSVEGAASRVQELLDLADTVYQCTTHNPPVVFAEKTDIELTATASGADASTSGTFDLIIVPE